MGKLSLLPSPEEGGGKEPGFSRSADALNCSGIPPAPHTIDTILVVPIIDMLHSP